MRYANSTDSEVILRESKKLERQGNLGNGQRKFRMRKSSENGLGRSQHLGIWAFLEIDISAVWQTICKKGQAMVVC